MGFWMTLGGRGPKDPCYKKNKNNTENLQLEFETKDQVLSQLLLPQFWPNIKARCHHHQQEQVLDQNVYLLGRGGGWSEPKYKHC